MTRGPVRSYHALVLAALLLGLSTSARAQEQTYTLAVREVALSAALERFVDATGLALSYDPVLVRGRAASCAAEDVEAVSMLECILKDSGLDYYRLSSGTYVLTESAEVAPQRGYLAGRVVDGLTGAPLSGAHVLLADAGMGAVTDRSGRFTLPALLPGPYLVSVSHLGYASWSESIVIHPSEQLRTEATLQPEPIVITPVVVDGLAQRPHREALGSPALSERPQGRMTEPPSILNLHALQGVRLSDATADVYVQGGDPGSHQLRLDGAPVFLPRTLVGFVGPFATFALDRLTVHRAGFGAAEGSHLSGVLLAEHALAPVNDVDVQADPYSMNARLRLAPDDEGRTVAMAAGRVGLWDIHAPARLQQALDEWSRPDPFLLLGPLENPAEDHTLVDPLVDAPSHPTVHFYDLHGAARLRFGPLSSMSGSLYLGGQQLKGGVFSGMDRNTSQAALTVVDEYAWTNRLGQLSYEAILGSRTLARVQLRASSYRLENAYDVVDAFNAALDGDSLRLTVLETIPVRDANRVATAAVEGTIDHARGPHQLQAGLEAGFLDSRFDLRSVYFPSDHELGSDGVQPEDGFVVPTEAARNTSRSSYVAAFGENRIRLRDHLVAEIGVRLTYLGVRHTVYAEPRAALLFQGSGRLGDWSARSAAGIYRQFLNQTDASKLNSGALLPSVRVWLPVDGSVRPPLSYHLTQDVLLQPTLRWSLQLQAYAKVESHGLDLRYAQVDSARFASGRVRQRDIYAAARSTGFGGSASLKWNADALRAEIRYGYEYAQRTSPRLFDGRRHPVPWIEPHRVEVAVDWLPAERMVMSARWKGVWSRPWGFRRAYYDYFGHDDDTRHHPPFDLGDPGVDVLPPRYQLDVSAAYTQPVGSADVQIRGEVVNVLSRSNVMDWRLVPQGTSWRREARTLYPVMPSIAVRLQF